MILRENRTEIEASLQPFSAKNVIKQIIPLMSTSLTTLNLERQRTATYPNRPKIGYINLSRQTLLTSKAADLALADILTGVCTSPPTELPQWEKTVGPDDIATELRRIPLVNGLFLIVERLQPRFVPKVMTWDTLQGNPWYHYLFRLELNSPDKTTTPKSLKTLMANEAPIGDFDSDSLQQVVDLSEAEIDTLAQQNMQYRRGNVIVNPIPIFSLYGGEQLSQTIELSLLGKNSPHDIEIRSTPYTIYPLTGLTLDHNWQPINETEQVTEERIFTTPNPRVRIAHRRTPTTVGNVGAELTAYLHQFILIVDPTSEQITNFNAQIPIEQKIAQTEFSPTVIQNAYDLGNHISLLMTEENYVSPQLIAPGIVGHHLMDLHGKTQSEVDLALVLALNNYVDFFRADNWFYRPRRRLANEPTVIKTISDLVNHQLPWQELVDQKGYERVIPGDNFKLIHQRYYQNNQWHDRIFYTEAKTILTPAQREVARKHNLPHHAGIISTEISIALRGNVDLILSRQLVPKRDSTNTPYEELHLVELDTDHEDDTASNILLMLLERSEHPFLNLDRFVALHPDWAYLHQTMHQSKRWRSVSKTQKERVIAITAFLKLKETVTTISQSDSTTPETYHHTFTLCYYDVDEESPKEVPRNSAESSPIKETIDLTTNFLQRLVLTPQGSQPQILEQLTESVSGEANIHGNHYKLIGIVAFPFLGNKILTTESPDTLIHKIVNLLGQKITDAVAIDNGAFEITHTVTSSRSLPNPIPWQNVYLRDYHNQVVSAPDQAMVIPITEQILLVVAKQDKTFSDSNLSAFSVHIAIKTT